jgi:hypothetical protein
MFFPENKISFLNVHKDQIIAEEKTFRTEFLSLLNPPSGNRQEVRSNLYTKDFRNLPPNMLSHKTIEKEVLY